MKLDMELPLSADSRSIWQLIVRFYRRTISSDFVQKVAETFVTKVAMIGIGLVTSVIVARSLGPEGRGLYAVAATIGAIGVQSGNLGLHASNTYYAARDRTLLPALVGNSIVVSFGFGTIGIAFIWFLFFFWPSLAPVHGLLLILSLIWIPFGLGYMLLQNLLLGIQEVRNYNKIELATKILGVSLLGLVIFLVNITVEKVFLAGLVALVIGFVWAFWRMKIYLVKAALPSLTLFKENIYYGLKAYLAAFFAFLVIRVDILMVKYMLGAEQTGYYSVAASMAEMVYILPVVVGTILFPKLSALSDIKEKWYLTKKVAVGSVFGMIPVLAMAGFLAKPIVTVLYGKAFLPSVSAFFWLSPGILFLGVETVAVQFVNSIGFPITVVMVWILASLLNVGLNMWAIPVYGIVGASMVSSLSYFVLFVLVIWVSRFTRLKHE